MAGKDAQKPQFLELGRTEKSRHHKNNRQNNRVVQISVQDN